MNSKRTLRDNSEKEMTSKRVKRSEKASTPSSSSSLEVIADIGRPSTPAAPTVLDYMVQHNEINELRREVAGLKERMTKLEEELEVPME
ncbi:hypothetical protein NUU61_009580 [Penicillium alfredii]|uniref:Uncharacterized protein n=1 Tax=Penicillium alfredii TaxID=1506179 RepID=A0A9W9JTR7_9EURO|nr:uncharacterized protein NUU61_009580 [Penicillium alfredii]KAJ5081316.1 hypothetical protein NUU61_009580 [Penicillium alfredii]